MDPEVPEPDARRSPMSAIEFRKAFRNSSLQHYAKEYIKLDRK
jgi:hypothetical protein